MVRKIDAMHSLYGSCQKMIQGRPAVCGDCPHYKAGRYHDRILRKCRAYGMTHSEATDWKRSEEPCGLFDIPLPGDFVPVIERLKHERVPEPPIKGQLSFLDGGEVDD